MRKFMTRIFMIASVFALCGSAMASAETMATPSPKPSAVPATNPVKISGNVRAFYFTRTNKNSAYFPAPGQPKGTPNAAAFALGGKFHAEYNFPNTPWTVGASYFGSTDLQSSANGPALLPLYPNGQVGYNPRVDNTLPGYPISTLGEMYLQYKDKIFTAQTGKEIINTPWANASDSRIVPVIFQGTWISAAVSPRLTLAAYDMARFKSRVTSAFNSNTLLTSCNTAGPKYFSGGPPGAPNGPNGNGPVQDPFTGKVTTAGVPGDPCNPQATNAGFVLLQGSYKFGGSGLVANVYNYQFTDIANLMQIDAKYNYNAKSAHNPFVAAQYFAENDIGKSLIGIVHNHTYGFQFGESFSKNIDWAASYNNMPQTAYVVAKAQCAPVSGASANPVPGGIFGGVANAAAPGLPAGQVLCYGGSIASPYTDSYATDPVYTTQISQGLADVHKPGQGFKLAATFQSNNRRLRVIASNAWYYYGLPIPNTGAGTSVDNRTEFNLDGTWFFNPVVSGKPYRGFSLRHRYAERGQSASPFNFKYNRTQLEYAF